MIRSAPVRHSALAVVLAVPGAAAQASLSLDSLVRLTTVEFKYPHFSPDGRRILFQSNETTWDRSTYGDDVDALITGVAIELIDNGTNDGGNPDQISSVFYYRPAGCLCVRR